MVLRGGGGGRGRWALGARGWGWELIGFSFASTRATVPIGAGSSQNLPAWTEACAQFPMIEKPRTFRDLAVWNLAMTVVTECYGLTSRFPVREHYVISSQLRRAAVSIPTNIAEGHNRRSRRAYLNHVNIALGSQAEVETLLELAQRLSLCDGGELASVRGHLAQVGRMLHALSAALADLRPARRPQPPAPSP